MQELVTVIQNGWPEKRNSVPESIAQHFEFCDSLSYRDGLIVKGEWNQFLYPYCVDLKCLLAYINPFGM